MNRRIYYLDEITGESVDKGTLSVNSSFSDKQVHLCVRSLEKLSISFSTPIPLTIISDVRRCSYVLCQSSLLVYQQMGDRHLKLSLSDLENAGVTYYVSWGIFTFLSLVLKQPTPKQEILLFFPQKWNEIQYKFRIG